MANPRSRLWPGIRVFPERTIALRLPRDCDPPAYPHLTAAVSVVPHESIGVRHLHGDERRRVERRGHRNDAIGREQVRRHGVHLIVAERTRRHLRHRAAHVVEHRRRVRPVVADRLHEPRVFAERKSFGDRVATDEARIERRLPFTALAVTRRRIARRRSRRPGRLYRFPPEVPRRRDRRRRREPRLRRSLRLCRGRSDATAARRERRHRDTRSDGRSRSRRDAATPAADHVAP